MKQDIKAMAYSLLDLFKERLPERDDLNIRGLIQAGEETLAIEDLCTQLYEWECKCTLEEIGQVEQVAEKLRLQQSYIDLLYQLVDRTD